MMPKTLTVLGDIDFRDSPIVKNHNRIFSESFILGDTSLEPVEKKVSQNSAQVLPRTFQKK